MHSEGSWTAFAVLADGTSKGLMMVPDAKTECHTAPSAPCVTAGASHGTVPTSCAGMLLQLHPGGSVRLVSGHQALTVPVWLFSMFLLTFADVTLALSLAALRGCMGCTVLCAAPAVCAVFILIDRIRSLMHCMKAVMQIYATCISRLCLAQDSNLLSSV